MTQPTVSSIEGQQLVSPPSQGLIPPGQALYKVKWGKYNFNKKKHLHSTIKSEDTEVLGGLRARPNEIKAQSSRPTWKTAHYDCGCKLRDRQLPSWRGDWAVQDSHGYSLLADVYAAICRQQVTLIGLLQLTIFHCNIWYAKTRVISRKWNLYPLHIANEWVVS